ncbi:MAG: M61 family metallopeptidase [Limnothrix sp. RL_2_0]|nr:M61 family metallopeptidase [Limnothrix sp. RL_2_0]
MVQAAISSETSTQTIQSKAIAEISYYVAMPNPHNHLFELEIQIKGWQGKVLDLRMPTWTPGSYLIREYARHVQDFAAIASATEESLTWHKQAKNHWQISTGDTTDITVRYRVYANELTVRTNHLDATHGYFNGAALFFFVPGYTDESFILTVEPPHEAWQINTTLPLLEDYENRFWVENFDVLVDSPVEVGLHESYEFIYNDKPHRWVVWGDGNLDVDQAIADTKNIIKVEADIYGGDLPYDEYMFLLHLSSSGYGGLEHKESCSLNYPRFGFKKRDSYNRFMQLVAHEFFHLWNVKRIRPKALEVFDYENENYTPSLWFSEGITSYYDLIIPLWAGVYNEKFFLESLGKDISRYLTTPGRFVQPLAESSFDAWVKLYRRDANSNNSQMSYYLKGAMVSLMLDLLIRDRHNNQKSLDNVMQVMWEQFGKEEIGFTPEQAQQVIEGVAGCNLDDFFQRYLHGFEEVNLDHYLEPFGLKLKPIYDDNKVPYLGAIAKTTNNQTLVESVDSGSPAHRAGIDPGDEILAIADYRITADQLGDRLQNYQAGDTISITIFQQDQLKTLAVTLAEAQPSSYQVKKNPQASATQQQKLKGWLQR